MSSDGTCNCSVWTTEQNKVFENALALYFGEPDDRWETIAATITGKTREEIKRHYEQLVVDVNAIESGLVPLPYCESSSKDSAAEHAGGVGIDKKGSQVLRRGKIPLVEKGHREKIKSGGRGYLGQKRNTSYFFGAWGSMEKVIGGAYPGTLCCLELLHRLPAMHRNILFV